MSFKQRKRGRIGTTTRLCVAFAALVASGAFIGVSSMGASAAVHQKTVTLHFLNAYNDVTEIPILDGVVIPAFESANPGIKVIDENVPYNGMLNKFIATAAACILVISKPTGHYLEDGSAASEHILLAAHAHGLGACWVAGEKEAYADAIRQLAGAPEGYRLICLIPVGYPAESPEMEKRSLQDVLHWETY